MGVLAALTRASCLFATVGCAASSPASALTTSELIVGRAMLPGRIVMLTNDPALITIEVGTNDMTRLSLPGGTEPALWGLGELDQILYSISAFSDLVRFTPGEGTAAVEKVTRLPRPVGNLVDTAGGMAAQLAVDDRGSPIAWRMDASGRLSGIQGAVRVPMGLSRAEESLLHLLSCSLPPRVLCWLPGSNELLTLERDRLVPLMTLGGVARIDPAAVLARPETRAIEDAIWLGSGRVAVLVTTSGSDRSPVVAEFDAAGRMLRALQPSVPVRMFVSAGARRLTAVARSGKVIEVPR